MHAPREGPADFGQDALSFPDVLRQSLSAGVMGLDGAGRVVLFNAAAEEITGLKGDTVLGQPCAVLPKSLREACEAGADGVAREIKIQHPARGEVIAQCAVMTERASSGATVRMTAVLHDLTSVRACEQGMRRLDRLASIGTLSAGMAHEIKNAMVSVKTFIDLLIQKNADAQLAGVVNREMHRINAIVSQMLRFAGPARPAFATVRVHDLLDQSLDLVKHQLEGRKISLHRALSARPDAVRGDGYQLEQVFLNLFFNAMDAMGPAGRLTVATEVVPMEQSELIGTPALRVSVRDSGTGIPPENLARLFEPFFTTKPNGTGLGLSITHRIVQEHRGVISVDSRPGEGAVFNILLPLAPPSPTALAP
jgi:two-component system nitrogen regulation sensor histidine kinase GlnL